MSGTRRLTKEYNDLQNSKLLTENNVKSLTISEQSILTWSGALNPTQVRFIFRKIDFFRGIVKSLNYRISFCDLAANC